MNPSQAESDAMAAFLALAEGDLTERSRLWKLEVERIQKQMQDKVKEQETNK
jgi:hypothetical protein